MAHKLKIIFVTLLLSTTLFAQSDYYSGTEGLYGNQLKSVLHHKIKGHKRYSYSQIWDILKETDRDPNNSANVILIYTNYSRSAAKEYDNGKGWNREHVWAKSHGFPNSGDTAYTDAHHLRPSDVNTNSTRGSKDFDYGGSNTTVLNVHYDSDSWEPRDEIKGDIARMMLYMTVRYEGGDGYDLELVEYTGTSGPKFGKKSVLLEWNRLDPVSAFERNRNRVIYKYQKNYNPFVDHPEYADRIYNSNKLIIEKAEQVAANQVVLSFSKELDATEVVKTANYNLTMLGNPSSATANFGGDGKKVLLSFSQNFADTFYNIRVTNLVSTEGEAVIPNSIALFYTDGTTVIDTIAPATPINLASEVIDGKIKLTWDANTESDFSHYALYKGIVENFAPNKYNLLTTTENNYFVDENVPDYKVYYKISAFDISGNESDYSEEISVIVDVNEQQSLQPQYSLGQNYPNPFNPSTTINFTIANSEFVNISVYNTLGECIAQPVNKNMIAGSYAIKFNAYNLPSGMYFCRMETPKYSSTIKMLLLK